MSELAVHLPFFVASANDVIPERSVVQEEIRSMQGEAAEQRLLLSTFSWDRNFYPIVGDPQANINTILNRSEIVVVIIWSRLGEGTQTELVRALLQAKRGQTDNVCIYFKTSPPADPAAPSYQGVCDLRRSLQESHAALTWDFRDAADFRRLFRRHVANWLHKWNGIATICEYALCNSTSLAVQTQSGDELLALASRAFDTAPFPDMEKDLGRAALDSYQRHGVSAARRPVLHEALSIQIPEVAVSPEAALNAFAERSALAESRAYYSPTPLYRDAAGTLYFASIDWFWYFCGMGALQALIRRDQHAFALHPLINRIHQHLSAIVMRRRVDVVPTLVDWLTGSSTTTSGLPIVRNFSAYSLGMLGVVDAQDALADAIISDPGVDVAAYCVTSLGKLRSRRHLRLLADLYQREPRPERRLLISQAVARISGIARYEL